MFCAALPLAAAIVRGPPILRYGSAAIDTRGAPSLIAPSSVASALEGTDSALDSMDLAALALDGSFRPTRGPDGRLEPVLTLPGDSLETTPPMGAVTVSSTAATLGVVALAFVRSGSPLPPLLGVAAGALLGELFSGAFHWATDNYGRLETPVVGFACAAFQGHHLAPWTISHRSVFNNVYKIAGATLPLLGLGLALLPPSGAACVAVMFYLQLVAQEFHRWRAAARSKPPRSRGRARHALTLRSRSHTPPSKLPEWKRRLQRAGVAAIYTCQCWTHTEVRQQLPGTGTDVLLLVAITQLFGQGQHLGVVTRFATQQAPDDKLFISLQNIAKPCRLSATAPAVN